MTESATASMKGRVACFDITGCLHGTSNASIGIHRPLRLQAAMRNSCFSLEMLSLTTRSTTGVLQSHSLFESWRGLSVDERHDTSKRRLNHINTSQLFSSSTSGMVPFHIQNLYPRHWAATLLAVLQYPPKWQQFPDISRRLHFGSHWYHPHALGRSKCGKSHIEPQQKREINFVQPVQIDSNHFNLRKLYKAMSSGANFGQYPKNRTLLYIVYAQFMMFSGCIEYYRILPRKSCASTGHLHPSASCDILRPKGVPWTARLYDGSTFLAEARQGVHFSVSSYHPVPGCRDLATKQQARVPYVP